VEPLELMSVRLPRFESSMTLLEAPEVRKGNLEVERPLSFSLNFLIADLKDDFYTWAEILLRGDSWRVTSWRVIYSV
jgi:hypothetical protein